jgi:hypothetical protein
MYDDYYIKIEPKTTIKVNQLNYNIPFIYSDAQTIDVKYDTYSYEFKFKFDSYNNDILYIQGEHNNYYVLDNCENSTNELVCTITREKIEEFLVSDGEHFILGIGSAINYSADFSQLLIFPTFFHTSILANSYSCFLQVPASAE